MSTSQTSIGAALAAALALCSSGCVYLQRRAQDLQDSIYLHAGVGLGAEAHVSAVTHIGMVGLGGHCSERIGIDGWQKGAWREGQAVCAFPLLLGVFDVKRPRHSDGMVYLPSFYGCVPFAIGNRFVVGPEAGCFVGVVGVEAGVDIIQFADFLTGLFGLDFLGDDRVDVDFVLSREWYGIPVYWQRRYVEGLRAMSDEQLVGFVPKAHGAARILLFRELVRREVPSRFELMVRHFDFCRFNTNEADMAHEILDKEAAALEPDDPRLEDFRKLDPDRWKGFRVKLPE
jgi:hypothetical protein